MMKLEKIVDGKTMIIELTDEEVDSIVGSFEFYMCLDDAALALIEIANLYDPNEQPGEYIEECKEDYTEVVGQIAIYVNTYIHSHAIPIESDWTIDSEPIRKLLNEAVAKYWSEDMRLGEERPFHVRVKEVNYYDFEVDAKSYEQAVEIAHQHYYDYEVTDCDVDFDIKESK